MARSRNLKPSFFTNDVLAEIDPLGRLLFQGLWCIADREGRLEDRPKRIKAELLPYDDCDAESLLQDLASHGFIVRYVVDSARFIQVVNFTKHQNPHVKEAASTIPAPDEHCASTAQEQEQAEQASEIPERAGLIPDSLNPLIDSGFLESPASPAPAIKKPRARKTSLPDDFGISERVTRWSLEKGFGDLPAHLEAFRSKAKANGYQYADWDEAFMNAIREDWAKLRAPQRGAAAYPAKKTINNADENAKAKALLFGDEEDVIDA